MQAEDSRIKSLHQEASSYYLRGEFREALEVWRGLIELNPEDERAKEGVRLCELLVDEGAADPAEPPAAPPPAETSPRPPFAEAAEGFDDDLEELDEILETGLGSAPATEQPAPEAGQAAEDEPAVFFDFSNVPDITDSSGSAAGSEGESASEGQTDLGDPAGTESLSVGEMAAQSAPPEQSSDVVDLPLEPETAGPAEAGAGAAEQETNGGEAREAAAAELRSRVNELLAEALTAYEQDHKEEALAVLNRIFILDENNHAALALHDNIRIELEAEQNDAAEAAAGEVPSEDGEADPLQGEPGPEGDEETAAGSSLEAEAEPQSAEAPSDTLDTPLDERLDYPDDEADLPPEAPPKRRLLGEGLLTRQNVFVAVALIVVVGLGGFLAFTFMGGPGEPAETGDGAAATAAAGVAPAVAVVLSEGVEDGGPAAPADGGNVPAEPDTAPQDPELLARRLDELLVQAREAMEREDWSAAVLACNLALEIDPSNTAVRDDLAEAGKRYREERALEQRHQEAIEAFNEGNYRAALTLLYRLPPGDDGGARLERYKRNGWYNMGIQALAVGDCKSATTHLNEARNIDPEDREILLGLDLARSCPYSRDTETFRDEVRQFVLRGLDD